ncbi:MAG: sulfoxide reductase heme-binding subunit YedZ [Magnetococcales bacterium]|nr:sulfoxide reductase heme-binding subunit YedZ [Magnetococcales bacterium]
MQIPQPVWLLLGLSPLARLIQSGISGGLGANPIEYIIRFSGDWALWLLLISLSISPIARLPGCRGVIRLRRLAGLFCFFYATLHLCSYLVLDKYFDWFDIGRDLRKRPYITVGFSTFLLLLPLAVTSSKGWIKRLGRHWGTLHTLVYPAAILAICHYFLMTKADWRLPALHALLLALLLGWRWRRNIFSPLPG